MLKIKRETNIVEKSMDLYDLLDLKVKTLGLYFDIPYMYLVDSETYEERVKFVSQGFVSSCVIVLDSLSLYKNDERFTKNVELYKNVNIFTKMMNDLQKCQSFFKNDKRFTKMMNDLQK